MLPAVLTACFFALSAVFSQRAARIFGPLQANAMRLGIACAVLGGLTLFIDAAFEVDSLHSELFPLLFFSGLIGFGLGDIAMFRAYPLLGARLTVLLNLCTATIFAAAGDRVLLDVNLTTLQWASAGGILAGLTIALWPEKTGAPRSLRGVIYAVIAGIGMGGGTVLSGMANTLATRLELHTYGISQAFQRAAAGLLAGGIAVALLPSAPSPGRNGQPAKWKHKPFWLMGTALFGPVIGVSCYQWARQLQPSAVVIAVAATSALLVIPLSFLVEKERPALRSIIGTLIATLCVMALCLLN